jgi:hypothetical protein
MQMELLPVSALPEGRGFPVASFQGWEPCPSISGFPPSAMLTVGWHCLRSGEYRIGVIRCAYGHLSSPWQWLHLSLPLKVGPLRRAIGFGEGATQPRLAMGTPATRPAPMATTATRLGTTAAPFTAGRGGGVVTATAGGAVMAMADGVVTDTAVGVVGGSPPSGLVSAGRTFPVFGVASAAGDAEEIFARLPPDAREARPRAQQVFRRPACGLREDEIVGLGAGDSDGTQMIILIVHAAA